MSESSLLPSVMAEEKIIAKVLIGNMLVLKENLEKSVGDIRETNS